MLNRVIDTFYVSVCNINKCVCIFFVAYSSDLIFYFSYIFSLASKVKVTISFNEFTF